MNTPCTIVFFTMEGVLVSRESAPILVIGAGPSGLTLGCELLRHGVPCRVFEKLTVPSDKSKALGVHARTLEMLENMGVVDKMLEIGNQAHCFSLYSGAQRIVQINIGEIDSPYPCVLMVPQETTERLLREQFESLGGKIERGIEFVGLIQDADGITVTLRNGEGAEETVRTPWLIGCDGAHSMVRKALKLTFEGDAYEERFALGDVDVESSIPEDEISTFFHHDGPMVYFPMGNKRFRVMAPVEESDVHGDEPSMDYLEKVAQKRCRPGIKFLKGHWLAWFRIHKRSVTHYSVGRVFLGGDSAHIHSPVGGQGMNTGMQDVYNLAWKMALVWKGLASPDLLDSYQQERHPIGQELLKGTDIATKVAVLRNPLAKQLRNHIMSFMSQQEAVLQRIRNVGTMMGVNYRHSKLIGEYHELTDVQVHATGESEGPTLPAWMEFARAPLPGEVAPDTVLLDSKGNAVRLYEVIRGTKHSLLLFDGKPTEAGYVHLAKIANEIKQSFGEIVTTHIIVASDKVPPALATVENVYCDPDLPAHERYGAKSEALYLVRPDWYIGFRSQPARLEPLVEHINKLVGKTIALTKA